MAKDTKLVEMVRDTVDRVTTTAEEIHKAIADLPLKVLEENKVAPISVQEVRRFQDRTIGAVYDLVRQVNRRVGALVAELVARIRSRGGADEIGRQAA